MAESESGKLVLTRRGATWQCVLYDGKTGEKIGELPAPIHKGTVYSCAWSPDGSKILTTSADKTARVWEANPEGSKMLE